MVEKENKYREHELEKYSSVGVTEESHKMLRKEKTKQGKSMMRLVDNLIKEAYGNATVRKVSGEQLDIQKDAGR